MKMNKVKRIWRWINYLVLIFVVFFYYGSIRYLCKKQIKEILDYLDKYFFEK